MNHLRAFADIADTELDLVGGKGLSLGLLARAGLPVPPGFCVTTAAYRQMRGTMNSMLYDAVMGAYRALGSGSVAVRSSATAEDGAVASFAGQQETILGVEGELALKSAIERCWSSLHTDRAKAYRQKQGVAEEGLAMAVVVQRLVHADTAGVLFTRDPNDPSGESMLIEASWGLGEAVVSGRVTPDSFQVERESGAVRNRRLGRKNIRITASGEQPVPDDQQKLFCLNDAQLAELADLGRRVEAFYGEPRDLEWAYADGRFWLLQARPITSASAADREALRRDEIERLRALADPRGTVWSRFNLIEVLPEPTPMTWSIVRYLLSGGGGSGLMYRDAGFTPAPEMERLTVYDLIGGRPYCNLSREPFMQAAQPQMDYPFNAYKNNPLLALDPKPEQASMYRGLARLVRLPAFFWRQGRFAQRISRLSQTFADDFRRTVIPAFVADVEKAAAQSVSQLDSLPLMHRLEHWVQRTLVEFARHSLKPTLFAQFSMQILEQKLGKSLGEARAREALAELSAGARPDPEADLPQAILDVAGGKIDRTEFIRRFGHRGSHEMELAHSRWGEDHAALDRLLYQRVGVSSAIGSHAAETPALQRWEKIAAEAKLNPYLTKWLAAYVERLQTYLGLRETAKHYLMYGYALIRRCLVELDRRFNLSGGIFFLNLDELPQLIQGLNLTATIEERRKKRFIALSLETPPVIFSDDLEAIGRAQPAPTGAAQFQGLALSAGVVEGSALVLNEPGDAPSGMEGYILVCPSTDPAWVPLFVQAKGLVMESGGTLSHGAIVAREFGLPAVAGLPGVQHQIKTGQKLRVDGGRGTVTVLE